MFSLPQNMLISPLKSKIPVYLAGLLLLNACAYRFTNQHIHRPENIKTMAVEAVFDTSREVLPHEILWESLQTAFAQDGHLVIVPQRSADALLRSHIFMAEIAPSGGTTTTPPAGLKDPAVFDRESPGAPESFKQLVRAGEFTTNRQLTIGVEIEVVNLRSGNVMFRRSYNLGEPYRSVKSVPGGKVTLANDFVRMEESLENSFRRLSNRLATRVVTDMLVN